MASHPARLRQAAVHAAGVIFWCALVTTVLTAACKSNPRGPGRDAGPEQGPVPGTEGPVDAELTDGGVLEPRLLPCSGDRVRRDTPVGVFRTCTRTACQVRLTLDAEGVVTAVDVLSLAADPSLAVDAGDASADLATCVTDLLAPFCYRRFASTQVTVDCEVPFL